MNKRLNFALSPDLTCDTDVPRFVRVKRCKGHAEILYELLKQRTLIIGNISHFKLPTRKQHLDFVMTHPYRAWYLVYFRSAYVGTVYLLRNNCIGLVMIKPEQACVLAAIRLVTQKFRPLPAIPSIRTSRFDINVSPENVALIAILTEMGAKLKQMTYELQPASN